MKFFLLIALGSEPVKFAAIFLLKKVLAIS